MRVIKHRKLNRLKNYNYSNNGYYFVTICALNRICHFGNIINNKIILSDIGKIVYNNWRQIPKYYSNVVIDQFIIMPNHIHGIIIIDNNKNIDQKYARTQLIPMGTELKPVGTEHCSVPTNKNKINIKKNYGLLSKIIKSFKNAVTNEIKKDNPYFHFYWQRSYHDHIIRSVESLNFIRQYLRDNPHNWESDRNFRRPERFKKTARTR